jgi:hypothetical protein
MKKTLLLLLSLSLSGVACETYDPPPEAALVFPEGEMWFRDSLIQVAFSEAVEPDSVRFSIWPHDLDLEGELVPGAEPIASGCTLAGCEEESNDGAPVQVSLSEDALVLTIEQGDLFKCREAQPFFIRIAAGLTDTAGRKRNVDTDLTFQVNPRPQGGPIFLDLDSGVVAMVADLGDIVPGVNLRLYFDMEIDETNGDVVIVATVGGLASDDLPNNTVDPDDLVPLYGPDGWTVLFTGTVYEKDCGEVYFETDTTDLHITVSQVILVHLNGLGLEATIRPGAGLDGRIHFDGYMHIEEGFFGFDLNDLGPLDVGGAAWEGNALRDGEVPAKLPRVCSDNPCAVQTEKGGDCQLADPWVQPASCL